MSTVGTVPAPDASVASASVRLLRERGPMSLADLAQELKLSGVDLGSEPEDELDDVLYGETGDELIQLPDDRWAEVGFLLEGRVFTHRLTAAEVQYDVLAINPDLELLLEGGEHSPGRRFVDGSGVELAFPGPADERPLGRELPDDVLDGFGSIVLRAGTLAATGAVEGDLVALRVTESGVDLRRLDETDLAPTPDRVREHLRAEVSPDAPTYLVVQLAGVCADVSEAFRTAGPPIVDVLAAAGVAHLGDLVAPADFDFARYSVNLRMSRIRQSYGLDEERARAVATLADMHASLIELVEAERERAEEPENEQEHETENENENTIEETDGDGTGHTVGSIVVLLADPYVATALLRETLRDDSSAVALEMLAEHLEQGASRGVQASARWLRSRAADRLGRIGEAEEGLQAAQRLNPQFLPALADLARFAADRGDAPRALDLLRRAGSYADPAFIQFLQRFLPRSTGPALARNQLCWCGSGRKFKVCHLHQTSALPLEERAAWLYQKAVSFVTDGPWFTLLDEVVSERVRYAGSEEAIRDLLDDPFAADLVLFEGGAFADFIDRRGELLPVDERLLADQWLLIERSVFDVTAVRRGEGFTARDVRTGDVHEVTEHAASRQLRVGALICARVVPTGKTMAVFGGIEPVSLHARDALLELLDDEPDPLELAEFCTQRFAPPVLVNTENEPLVLQEVVLATSAPEALAAALDTTYERIEQSDVATWHHLREIDGFNRVLATLRLTGAELSVETNSDARMAAVRRSLHDLAPDLAVVSEQRQPIPDAREAARLAEKQQPSGGSPFLRPSDQPPEIQAALLQHMLDYENRWLDLDIPALHGLTPRQAAADPTRREDLIRLLDSFGPEPDSPMGMSPRRLRALLGL